MDLEKSGDALFQEDLLGTPAAKFSAWPDLHLSWQDLNLATTSTPMTTACPST